MKQTRHPDEIVDHCLMWCVGCGMEPGVQPAEEIERRQVSIFHTISVQVPEYRARIKTCLSCLFRNRAVFSEFVTQLDNKKHTCKILQNHLSYLHQTLDR